jgi:hypothetical protein
MFFLMTKGLAQLPLSANTAIMSTFFFLSSFKLFFNDSLQTWSASLILVPSKKETYFLTIVKMKNLKQSKIAIPENQRRSIL